jgi:hypothetical protein
MISSPTTRRRTAIRSHLLINFETFHVKLVVDHLLLLNLGVLVLVNDKPSALHRLLHLECTHVSECQTIAKHCFVEKV